MARRPQKLEEEHNEEAVTQDLSIIELDGSLEDAEKPPELPPAVYTGEIQGVQLKDSQKGNQYFAISFKIPPDEIPANMRDHYEDGATMFYNRLMYPKDARSKFNLKKFVQAIGLSTNTTVLDPNDWMGCQAKLRLRMGTFEGEKRAEIASVEPMEAQKRSTAAGSNARSGKR